MSWTASTTYEAHGARRGRTWRTAVGILTAALGLAFGASFASAGNATAATCPPGTSLFLNVCIVIGRPPVTPTTTPVTTPPTTAPPLVTLPPVTVPPVVAPILPSAPQIAAAPAQRLLDLVNGERERAGLGRLTSRDDIVTIAVNHSREMAQKGELYHSDSFFGAAVKNLLNAAVRGENVAYNGDIENTHVRLMASTGHRANILDPRFTAVGIGVVQAADGRYFVTENFIQAAGAPAAPRAAAPRATAPRPAAPAASRKAPAPAPAAAPVAPPTTAPAPPTTLAPPAPTPAPPQAPPVVAIDNISSAVSATSPEPAHAGPLAAAAAVLLLAALVTCCVVIPANRWS